MLTEKMHILSNGGQYRLLYSHSKNILYVYHNQQLNVLQLKKWYEIKKQQQHIRISQTIGMHGMRSAHRKTQRTGEREKEPASLLSNAHMNWR